LAPILLIIFSDKCIVIGWWLLLVGWHPFTASLGVGHHPFSVDELGGWHSRAQGTGYSAQWGSKQQANHDGAAQQSPPLLLSTNSTRTPSNVQSEVRGDISASYSS
jgi:hypothetical protein